MIPVINKEAETPSSLNQPRRNFESPPHTEQREAVKLDLLSLWGYPEQSHAADAGLGQRGVDDAACGELGLLVCLG